MKTKGILLGLMLTAAVSAQTAFPLKVSENKRYLVDSAGKPFFYQADTAWMLLLKLDPAQAEEYLKNRKAQGFNAVQITLTGFLGMKNLAGQLPFEGEHDFARPNEAYFAHADGVIRMASDMGLLLSIAPAWSGCCGEGWAGMNKDGSPKPLNKNGPAKCRALGRYLGQRYGKFDNIIWILGGDIDPDNAREELRQLGLGLKEAAPRHMITYHAFSTHSSTDVWPIDESWLDVSMVYTYFRGFNKAWNKNQPDVYEISHAEYAKSRVRPFFLGESTYEGEHGAWGSALQARKQAYWCVLGGGCGHAYGSPNYNFPKNWRQVMEQPGAVSMKYVRGLFESLPWWTLVPDIQNTVVVEGRGEWATNSCATAARTPDGSLAIVYLPQPRPITVDLSRMSGSVTAKWYDPTSGDYTTIEGSPLANEGKRQFAPPQKNAAGDSDRVLLLEAEAAKKTVSSIVTQPVVLDPMAEFEAAQKAEKVGDFDQALTHYENIFDSTRQPMRFPSRTMLHGKLAELKRKVSPNTDPAKAGQWKVKAYAFRTTDVKWTDKDGKDRHARFDFTDPQIDNLKLEMTNFAAKVWGYSHGNLRIVWDLTVIDKPLTEWHGWPELGVCMPYFTDLQHGQADSVFVFAKAAAGKEDKPCDPLEWGLWGGTIGVTAETKGACYIGFNCGPDPAQNSSGELELHEWTHAAEMAMRWAQAYEDGDIVDWYGDGGGYCEQWGLWKRPPGDETWLNFYQTIFRDWTTRKMWRELTVNGHSDNPWLRPYVRQFLALGPFGADGKANGGLDEAFIDESSVQPKSGEKAGGLEWKRANCPGKFATLTPVFGKVGDGKVYYLAFTAKAGLPQNALLHSQRDGMCKIWQNGQPVYASRVNREWSSKPNVLDIALTKGDNRFLIKLTNISGDWSFSLKLTDLGGSAIPDVTYSAQ